MKAISINPKQLLLTFALFTLLGSIGCKKDSTDEPEFGCDTKDVLETLTNTPGILVYNPTQAEWQVSIDLGSNRKFSCLFCDQSAYAAKVAGQSTNSAIPITVSGSVKRRVLNQIPVSPTTGYIEVYVLTSTAVN